MCDPPRPAEMEPVSPASAGGFFPTGPTREALVLYTHTCICFYFYFLAVPGTQLQHSASAIFIVACRIFLVISCLTRDRTAGLLLRECWNLSHWTTRQFPEASFLTPCHLELVFELGPAKAFFSVRPSLPWDTCHPLLSTQISMNCTFQECWMRPTIPMIVELQLQKNLNMQITEAEITCRYAAFASNFSQEMENSLQHITASNILSECS